MAQNTWMDHGGGDDRREPCYVCHLVTAECEGTNRRKSAFGVGPTFSTNRASELQLLQPEGHRQAVRLICQAYGRRFPNLRRLSNDFATTTR